MAKNQFNDLGLGTQVKRLVNKDGTFNIRRIGLGFNTVNSYQYLIRMSWTRFLILVTAGLFLLNTAFAIAYFSAGSEGLSGIVPGSPWDHFIQCFFFSFQTFTTVGYGHIAPRDNFLSFLSALEAMTGLMVFAIITGLLYGRFAKPSAKILFSENMLMSNYKDGNGLQFRIVNKRSSTIMEVTARVILSYQEKGKPRAYEIIELERDFVTLFPLNWTIVHPINAKSPLYNKEYTFLSERDAEFIVVIKGYDDTFSQEVNAIHSYRYNEIIWGATFDQMYEVGNDNIVELDFGKLNSYHKINLK